MVRMGTNEVNREKLSGWPASQPSEHRHFTMYSAPVYAGPLFDLLEYSVPGRISLGKINRFVAERFTCTALLVAETDVRVSRVGVWRTRIVLVHRK